jgi:hypothetical protein
VSVKTGTDGNTYALDVGIPTSTGGTYSFKLTETTSATPSVTSTLANFAFKDSGNFSIDVDMPSLSSTDGVAIEAGFHLKEGSVTPAAAE